MSIYPKLILQVWGGGFDLASVNSDCLSVMSYCKCISDDLENIEFKVCNDPYSVSFRNLPLLTVVEEVKSLDSDLLNGTTERTISGVTNILDEIRKFGSKDCKLNTKQSADVLAYTSMIQRNLVPALNYLWWVENYDQMTKTWYTKQLPLFLKPFWTRRQQSHHMVALSIDASNAKSFNTQKIFENATNCLKILSQKLGKKKYFFNDCPSTLDVIVFGHLSMLEHVPFVNCELVKQYRTYANLVDHCALLEPCLSKYVVKSPEPKIQFDLSNDSGFSKKKNILFALFSISAMVAYAFASGLVKIDFTDDDDIYDEAPDFNEFDDPESQQIPDNDEQNEER